jgi:serine/threonine-protein phosphatase 4 regulatory subunit 1
VPSIDGKPAIIIDDGFWKDLAALANDEIIGVRISLARFIGLLRGTFAELLLIISI